MKFLLLCFSFVLWSETCARKEPVHVQPSHNPQHVPDYVGEFASTLYDKKGNVFYLIPCYSAYLQAMYEFRQITDIQHNSVEGVRKSNIWDARQMMSWTEKAWRKFAVSLQRQDPKLDPQIRFMIVRGDGAVVGACGLQYEAKKAMYSVYYDVWPSMRRRGIAAAAATKMAEFFFRYWASDLYLYCLETNIGSQNVAKSAKFLPVIGADGKQRVDVIKKRRYLFYRKRAAK